MTRAKAFANAGLIENFLDMMSAERGASINTIAALHGMGFDSAKFTWSSGSSQ